MTQDERERLRARIIGASTPERAEQVLGEAEAWLAEHPDDAEVEMEIEMLEMLASSARSTEEP
jgi:hypothetical protein